MLLRELNMSFLMIPGLGIMRDSSRAISSSKMENRLTLGLWLG